MNSLSFLLALLLLFFGSCQQVGLNINNTAVATSRNSYRSNMCLGCFNISTEDKSTGETLLNYYKSQFSR